MQVIESFKPTYNPARAAQASLREPFWQLDLLKTFIENSGDGITAFDLHLNCVLWNPVMERLSGVNANQAMGRSIFDTLLGPQDLDARESVFAALLGRTVTLKSESLERLPIRLDSFYSPLTDPLGAINGGIVIVRPASEGTHGVHTPEFSLSPSTVDIDQLDNLR